jgi:hypothetical protein
MNRPAPGALPFATALGFKKPPIIEGFFLYAP